MAYDIEPDFEDARGFAIDPEKAKRAHRLWARWMQAINDEFPDALGKGDPEDRDIVMMGTAALLGEMAGLIWAATHEQLARKVLATKYALAQKKMEMVAIMATKRPN